MGPVRPADGPESLGNLEAGREEALQRRGEEDCSFSLVFA